MQKNNTPQNLRRVLEKTFSHSEILKNTFPGIQPWKY